MSTHLSLRSIRAWCIIAAVSAVSVAVVAQERDRAKIPEQYKWNLADIYPTEAAWRAAKDKLAAELPQLAAVPREARLVGDDAGRCARQAVRARQGTVASLRLREHAGRSGHARRHAPGRCSRRWCSSASAFGAQAAFVEPELLRAGKATLERFVASEPRLKVYRFYLDDVARRAAHTLTDNEEKILADAGPLAGGPSDVYGILANADFPYPSVTLSDGRTVKLDQAAFSDLRALPNRADREKVMAAFFNGARRLQPARSARR